MLVKLRICFEQIITCSIRNLKIELFKFLKSYNKNDTWEIILPNNVFCLLYLLCLKRKQRRLTIVLIAFSPFIPWIVYNAFYIVMSLGMSLIFMFMTFVLPIFYMGLAFLNTELLIYCSWKGPKRKIELVILVIGYLILIKFGYWLGHLVMCPVE